MNEVTTTVIGIDVGGERKGFHAVALQNGTFVATLAHTDPALIVSWCRQLKAMVVAVDAPCGWSAGGASRLAERSLAIGGNKISCFATPTRARANRSNFYKWVFNGVRLYQQLAQHYRLFDGARRSHLWHWHIKRRRAKASNSVMNECGQNYTNSFGTSMGALVSAI